MSSFLIDINKLSDIGKTHATMGTCCESVKDCVHKNKRLDYEQQKIDNLRAKYNMDPVIDQRLETIYMLDPTDKSQTSKHVKFSTDMFIEDLRGGCPINDNHYHQINPNAFSKVGAQYSDKYTQYSDKYTQYPDKYMLYPGTNQVIPKDLFKERQTMRIYPHMMNAEAQWEAHFNKPHPPQTPGGVDYPIPERWTLKFLQQADHPTKGHGVDELIHIKHRSRNLPEFHSTFADHAMMVASNVDYQNTDRMQRAIDDKELAGFLRDLHPGKRILNDRVKQWSRSVGSFEPTPAQRAEFQLRRKLNQERDVSTQPLDLYGNAQTTGAVVNREGAGLPRSLANRYSQFGKFFEGHASLKHDASLNDGNMNGDSQVSYPSKQSQKTSFFGLGPPIPPPNPLLLSNIPSDLTLHRRELIDPRERITDIDPDKTRLPRDVLEGFSGGCTAGYPGRGSCVEIPNRYGIQHASSFAEGRPIAEPCAGNLIQKTTRKPATNGAQGEQGEQGAGGEQDEQPRFIGTPLTKVPANLAQQVAQNYAQQVKVLDQVGELFRLMPMLRERIQQLKIRGHVPAVAETNKQLAKAQETVGKLNDVLTTLKTIGHSLLTKLEKFVQPDVYSKFVQNIARNFAQAKLDVQVKYEAPAQGKVEAFKQGDFGGATYTFGVGFYDYPDVGGIGNNALASLKIPAGMGVMLFKHARKQTGAPRVTGVGGSGVLVYRGPKWVPKLPAMWQGQVSGMEVMKIAMGPIVEAWEAPFFQGNRVSIGVGNHNYPKIGGIGNGLLASMIIPDGLTVKLWDRPDFTGETIVFRGPQRISYLPPAWTERTKSLQIFDY